MPLSEGTHLGPYEIETLLGAGGMGEVYRARDTRLDRIVAIKVLPAQVAADRQLRERLEREARTISQLDHPHICALHDIGHQNGTDYLVLEYLQGETLAHRLGRGALPFEQALAIATDVADALDTAHRHHIVHRDLKPGNIMLTKSGVKLLDFGLAKVVPAIANGIPSVSALPTGRAPLTGQGTLLGTLNYMAPEQLEGREADARTDIFAFGEILYEMITGARPFQGNSQASLIAAILEHEPAPMATLQPLAPALLDRVVRKCLEKDPDDRWQDVRDLRVALSWLRDHPDAIGSQRAEAAKRSQRLPWATAAIVLWAITATGIATIAWRRDSRATTNVPSSPLVQFVISDPPSVSLAGGTPSAAAAANGSVLVYLSTTNGLRRLYQRRLEDAAASVIAGTEAASIPFVSPDGRWAGFTQSGRLKKVSLEGGAPVTICEIGAARGAAWGTDDSIIFSTSTDSGLWRVPAAGGVPVLVTQPDGSKGERSHRWPHLLPGNRAVLYTIAKSDILSFDDATIALRDLVTGETRELVRGGSYPMYAATGHLLYSRAGTMLAAPFDEKTLKVTGSSTTILNSIVTYPSTGAAQVAISQNGWLVSMAGGATQHHTSLSFVDRHGNATAIPFPPALFQSAAVSPDGRAVAIGLDNANASIWMGDLVRATATRLTLAWSNNDAVWSPDGKRVVFTSGRGGARNVFWQAVENNEPEQLTHSDHNQVATSWSSDGRYIVYNDQGPATPRDIFVIAVADRKERPLIQTPFDEHSAKFSPDGKWIAYVSNESGTAQVYLQTFPELKQKTLISREGGTLPVWSRNGRELYYRNGANMMTVSVSNGPHFSIGTASVLFRRTSQFPVFDVTPDGRFLMIDDRDSPLTAAALTVRVNWLDVLRTNAMRDARTPGLDN